MTLARSQMQRLHTLPEALSLVQEELHRLQMKLELTPVANEDLYHIYAGVLQDNENGVKARSSGKGLADQAVASASFEALEHYHMLTKNHEENFSSDYQLMPLKFVAEQAELSCDQVVQRMSRVISDAEIGCALYKSINGQDQVWYPLAIGDIGYRQSPLRGDNFDYEPFLRYCSTSGVASGTALCEAKIHSILELIERDAVSLALLGWFVNQVLPFRRVEPESLPKDLQQLLESISKKVGSKIVIADVSSDLGIPTYLAFPEKCIWSANIAGSGASLNPAYAIERALGEVLQEFSLLNHYKATASKIRQHSRVARWKVFKHCLELDWEWLQRHLQVQYCSMPNSFSNIGLQNLQATLVQNLDAKQLSVFWRHLTPNEARINVVHTIIPGIEGFFLVRTGHPVLPTGRGHRLWNQNKIGGN